MIRNRSTKRKGALWTIRPMEKKLNENARNLTLIWYKRRLFQGAVTEPTLCQLKSKIF
jgi:hypothetical protein